MALPAPTFVAAHGLLQLAHPVPRDPVRDQALIQAVQNEFPNLLNHSLLPADVPPVTPHLTLASTSSQLAISAAQADFEVRFYGDYVTNLEKGLDYVERKLDIVLGAFHSVGLQVTMIGLIATLHFSFEAIEGETPAAHILRTHLRTGADPTRVQDALARVALKLRDTYFVTLTLSNFESRVLERPIMPGMSFLRLRPWEGRVEDTGLELAIDINNNLEARMTQSDPHVTADAIKAVANVLREVAVHAGPEFAESGQISVEELTASSAP